MGLEKLNFYKKQKGMTNQQLANLTGITISTIDKITSGNNTNPKLRTIEALCNALGCTLDDIMDYNDDTKKDTPTDSGRGDEKKDRLISNYDKLNAEGQEKLVGYSDDLVATNRYVKSNAGADKVGA